jgi:hypothetical protein
MEADLSFCTLAYPAVLPRVSAWNKFMSWCCEPRSRGLSRDVTAANNGKAGVDFCYCGRFISYKTAELPAHQVR